jgi:hypothetical protein
MLWTVRPGILFHSSRMMSRLIDGSGRFTAARVLGSPASNSMMGTSKEVRVCRM